MRRVERVSPGDPWLTLFVGFRARSKLTSHLTDRRPHRPVDRNPGAREITTVPREPTCPGGAVRVADPALSAFGRTSAVELLVGDGEVDAALAEALDHEVVDAGSSSEDLGRYQSRL